MVFRRKAAMDSKWHRSRYNLFAKVPGTDRIAGVNLYKGICGDYSPVEMYLLSEVENLPVDHPIIERFRKRGLITDYDEREALYTMGRLGTMDHREIGLTICPTMGCNFDCPYCFEDHKPGRMTPEVQDQVVAFVEKILQLSGAKALKVTWFGGEPLLMPDIIDSLSVRLMELANQHGAEYRASIITNGYLLDHSVLDILVRSKIEHMQITLDGLRENHDATRHLAGGGGTFDRIIRNLKELSIPFQVKIRQNVHEGNRQDVKPLEELVRSVAEESGNDICHDALHVAANDASSRRGSGLELLNDEEKLTTELPLYVTRFKAARGHYCSATRFWDVGIDEAGRLYKCWEHVDKPELSFGTVDTWDPTNPIDTATNPDILCSFLNMALPNLDPKCAECIWLPACVGGCPVRRLEGRIDCINYKDKPEVYVLKLYEQMMKNNENNNETGGDHGSKD